MPDLSLIAYEPVSERGLYARDYVDDITANESGYNHVISAVGGFDQAGFTLGGTRGYLDDWFEDGLFRRVVFYNPQGIPVWEGYVNRMRYTRGTLQSTKALDNMFNRVYLTYSPTTVINDQTVALPPQTIIVDDLTSQAEFGVKGTLISGGERTDEIAYDWARSILNDRTDVKTGESHTTAGGDAPNIEIECKGFYHTLKWVPYIQDTTGEIQSHQVIQEVLLYFNGVNPGFISTDFGWMDYNFKTSRRDYANNLSCWDVIASTIGEGGKGGERWVGGVYQDRKMIYKEAEAQSDLYGDQMELWRALEDEGQFIFDEAGFEVKPWDMIPDRMLRTVDIR